MQKVGEQQCQHEIHNMNHDCFFMRLNPLHQVMSSKTVLIHDQTVDGEMLPYGETLNHTVGVKKSIKINNN